MYYIILFLLFTIVSSAGLSASAQDSGNNNQFKLQAEQQDYIMNNTQQAPPTYPAYGFYGAPSNTQKPTVPKPPRSSSPKPPQTEQVRVNTVLPKAFMGTWQVLGNRQNIQAQPQYQAGIDSIFQERTANVWHIQGNAQQGYVMANDLGISTKLTVDNVQGNTAYLRYQHPIKNTMAQEVLVMRLDQSGQQFNGLERITIVKPGETQPRCTVQYQLLGRRQ